MTYTCSDLPFTAAYHHDLTDMISPGQAAVLPGYAGGRKRKRNKTRKKSRNKTRKNKYIKKKNRRGGYMTQAQQKAINPKLQNAAKNAREANLELRKKAEAKRKARREEEERKEAEAEAEARKVAEAEAEARKVAEAEAKAKAEAEARKVAEAEAKAKEEENKKKDLSKLLDFSASSSPSPAPAPASSSESSLLDLFKSEAPTPQSEPSPEQKLPRTWNPANPPPPFPEEPPTPQEQEQKPEQKPEQEPEQKPEKEPEKEPKKEPEPIGQPLKLQDSDFAQRVSQDVDEAIKDKKEKLKENLDLIRNDISNDYTKNEGSIEYIKNILNEDIYNESDIESIKDFDSLNKIIEKIKKKFLFPEDKNIKLVTKENFLKYYLSLYEFDNFTFTCVKCTYDNNKVMKNNKPFFDIQTQGSVKGFINRIYRNVNKKFKLLQKDLDNEIKDIKDGDFHEFIENKLSEIFSSIPDNNDYLDLIIKIIDSNKSKIPSSNIDKVKNYLVKLGDKYRELINKEAQKSNPIQFKMIERPRAWAHDQNIKQMETVKKSEPAQAPVENKKGFFGKIKGFFSGGRKITRRKRNKKNKTRKNRTRKYRTKRNKTNNNNNKRRNQTKRKKNRTIRRR